MGKGIIAVALAFGLAFSTPALSQKRGAKSGDFDFYVLSLSWSPSYCATEGSDANSRQCDRDTAPPYAFIVHGLWPQYEKGYPEYCPSGDPARVPERLVKDYLDIVPSAALIGHQWRKHGTCTGLDQAGYFELLRKARDRITVPPAFRKLESAQRVSPDDVEKQFVKANPGMTEDGVAVTCEGHFLEDVRICMTRSLEFRACEEVNRKSCQRPTVLLPPT